MRWIGIKHEDLAKVGAGGAQQVQAIRLGFGERLLVAEDDSLLVVIQFAESNEAAAFVDDPGKTGYGETLRVREDARLAFLGHNAGSAPRGKVTGSVGVNVSFCVK